MQIGRDRKNTADEIRAAVLELGGCDARYWEFRRQAKREGLHALLQYPAMMVPRMQGNVLDAILRIQPNIESILDPFVGAGTTLLESIVRGRSFTGLDVNPLAILACEAKSTVFRTNRLRGQTRQVLERISADHRQTIDVRFAGLDKWFCRRTAISLSRIRRSIMAEPERWIRRILWVVFAETVRRTSRSRTSTFKLHIRPEKELSTLPNPENVFSEEAVRAVEKFGYHEEVLAAQNLLKRGRLINRTELLCRDARDAFCGSNSPAYDLILTSPPYGDNRSTVPYGQFSYLALNWIPSCELPGDSCSYSNTHATDFLSLGGSLEGYEAKAEILSCVSGAFQKFYIQLAALKRRDLSGKVAAFVYDFYDATVQISSQLRPGGLNVWTLGNRTVGGMHVPLVEVCREVQQGLGMHHVVTVCRSIPQKRSPTRNSLGHTVANERILVMRNGDLNS